MYLKTIILSVCMLNAGFQLSALTIDPTLPDSNPPAQIQGMELKWNDEFNVNGKPNPANWKYENGFVRNEELQWYQSANVNCVNGVLLLQGKREQVQNPNYVAGSTDWKKNRQYADFTSGSIISQGLQSFQFGRFEIRARIDTTKGSWPAIWTKGISGSWPNCGETDIMEFYISSGAKTILANVAWGSATAPTVGTWDTKKTALSYFLAKDPDWCKKFHVWRMDWTKDYISLYLDDELLNDRALSTTLNPALNPPTITVANPHLQKHFFLLNLALGANGGTPATTTNSIKYEVDYIRVYQDASTPVDQVKMQNIHLYPNPTRDFLNIDSEKEIGQIALIDMTGREVLSFQKPSNSINIKDLQSGIYLTRISLNNGNTITTRIQKQ